MDYNYYNCEIKQLQSREKEDFCRGQLFVG